MANTKFGMANIALLNSKNYTIWSMKIEALLRVNHLIESIYDDEPIAQKSNPMSIVEHDNWEKRNDEAYGLIILHLSDEQALTVRGIRNAKNLWDNLKNRYASVVSQRKMQLRIELAKITKLETESIDEYLLKAQAMSNELAQMGTTIDESELIGYILEGLPRKYREVTTALNANSSVTYDIMRDNLLSFEKKYDNAEFGEVKAFKTKEKSKVECYQCGKIGHIAKNCWHRQSRENTNFGKHRQKFNPRFQNAKEHTYRNYGDTRGKKIVNERNEHTRLTKEHGMKLHEDDVYDDESDENEMEWLLDSACSSHMTNRNGIVVNRRLERIKVTTAETNRQVEAECRGEVKITTDVDLQEDVNIRLLDVLYVPKINENLMSVPSLVKNGKRIIFDDKGARVYDKKTGELIAKGNFKNNSFIVKTKIRETNGDVQACFRISEETRELWHRRLGHVNDQYLNRLYQQNLVNGIRSLKGEEHKCEACIQGKLTKLPYRKIQGTKTTHVLERLHVDLCGPINIESLNGSKYILMIVDEYSRRYFPEFTRSKDQVPEKLRNFIERRENETGRKVKYVRSDNGTEFTNEFLTRYYQEKGIKAEKTTIHSPQSNGVAERANRSVIDTARTLLIEARLPVKFWAEATWTAVYTHNVMTVTDRNKTPLELWSKRKPTVQHLRIFGCKVFYYNECINRKKFDARSKPGIFIGYSRERRAYRLFDIKENKIKESRNVKFLEDKRGYDNKDDLSDYSPEGFEYGSSKSNNRLEVQEYESSDEVTDDENFNECDGKIDEENVLARPDLRRSTRERKVISRYSASAMQENIPNDYDEATKSKDKDSWKEAIKSELNSIEEHKIWSVVEKPKNEKILRCKWVFSKKTDAEGNLRYKARLVADGSRQICSRESTFSPVIKPESFRVLLNIAATKGYNVKFFDVETAYLNGTLNRPVYLNPPKGMEIERGKILKVSGSLYGLPEAGRCWFEKFKMTLRKLGLHECKADPCVFVNNDPEEYVAIGIYVDDGVIIGNSDEAIRKMLERLKKEVKIKEMKGKITFLGIDVEEDEEGFLLKQEAYIEKILRKYNMQECKPVKTPGVKGLNLDEYNDSKKIDVTVYQEMLGSIMYLSTETRPDLSYTVSKLSQYSKDPREIHLQAIKRVLRYIQGSKKLGLRLRREVGKLNAASDASWCTTKDSKSFGGYVMKIGNNLISWKGNKQKIVTLSTMESELLSFCDAVCEFKWLKGLLEELRQEHALEHPVKIYTDSQSLIDWIKNPRVNGRNKHISRKYHFVKDEKEAGEIDAIFRSSSEMEADLLTKDLSQTVMLKHLTSLGLMSNDVKVRKGGSDDM